MSLTPVISTIKNFSELYIYFTIITIRARSISVSQTIVESVACEKIVS